MATSVPLAGVVDSSMGENAMTFISGITRVIYVETYGGYVNLERRLKYPICRLPSLSMDANFIILGRGMNEPSILGEGPALGNLNQIILTRSG